MTMQGPEYAVFTELSPDNKAMAPGFNTRVFTDVDSQRGNSIRCDFRTGATTLGPGCLSKKGVLHVDVKSRGGAARDAPRAIPRRSRLLPAANLRPEGDCGPV